MFETISNNPPKDNLVKNDSQADALFIPLMWGEHCIECSAPQCYFTCPRYEFRPDGHCRRFVNGIEFERINDKLGARVKFKAWSKLEAKIEHSLVDRNTYNSVYKKLIAMGASLNKVVKVLPGFKLKSKCQGMWETYRMKLIKKIQSVPIEDQSLYLFYSIINEKAPTSIFIDLKGREGDLLMRERVELPKGETIAKLKLERYREASAINVHPSNIDEEIELLFEELEVRPFIPVSTPQDKPKKVKCVIWDLDNTLWDGVLIEKDIVTPKPELVTLIKALDSKGIVNSIASKNNEEQVIAVLEKAGIADLFVFNKINWDPKSQNIQKTIKGMNINANTFVLVDDNPFEREEVKSVIPEITCIDPSEVLAYSKTERFDVPISEESAKRRETYKMLEQLNKEQESWTGNIDSFLLNCQITLTISSPTDNNILRCYELLQRTNQLNSSGRRLSMEELRDIVGSPDYNCYVMESSDKFGSYGIVGFMIVKVSDTPCITDFVISCRVANKKIEPTLVNYLANKYGGMIGFNFKKTKLNGPMKKVIDELKMDKIDEYGEMELYCHTFDASYPHIVTLTDKTND